MVQVHVWRECEGMASVVRRWCDQCARRATKWTQIFCHGKYERHGKCRNWVKQAIHNFWITRKFSRWTKSTRNGVYTKRSIMSRLYTEESLHGTESTLNSLQWADSTLNKIYTKQSTKIRLHTEQCLHYTVYKEQPVHWTKSTLNSLQRATYTLNKVYTKQSTNSRMYTEQSLHGTESTLNSQHNLSTECRCRCNIYSVYRYLLSHAQLAAGDQFIVWLLVSTSHIGHHQADCTQTGIQTETVSCCRRSHLTALKYTENVYTVYKCKVNGRRLHESLENRGPHGASHLSTDKLWSRGAAAGRPGVGMSSV